ncbi:MAG: adenylate cyclase [Methylobacteriaceae bacterium]|nr:adenylate cyclase [Methylobacteriaceae bacterium]
MHKPPLILAVDDVAENLDIVQMRLEAQGYGVETAADGEEAIARARELSPDLILLDIMMPKLDGIAALKILKQDQALRFIPVILLTAKADRTDVIAGLEAGGDDYLTKPIDQASLTARVRSMLRIKALNDELDALNQSLETRVAQQVAEIERVSRLRRFLAPQIADVIASSDGQDKLLQSHRREISVLFCDLRGFTSFTETNEPEEVMGVISEYIREMCALIDRYEGTIQGFAGDGIIALFNDPVPCADHAERAVRLAADMRDKVAELAAGWSRRGLDLGCGIGVALGYATLGTIGFERRLEYSAIGSVMNLASRLCDEAKPGQIIVSRRVFSEVEPIVEAAELPPLTLKGFSRPVPAYEIVKVR